MILVACIIAIFLTYIEKRLYPDMHFAQGAFFEVMATLFLYQVVILSLISIAISFDIGRLRGLRYSKKQLEGIEKIFMILQIIPIIIIGMAFMDLSLISVYLATNIILLCMGLLFYYRTKKEVVFSLLLWCIAVQIALFNLIPTFAISPALSSG